MIFGIQTDLFEDRNGRKILHLKSTNTYYLVPEKKEGMVKLLQNNIINAITLSLIIGMFFSWPPVVYAVVAAAIYFGYLQYFSKQVFPSFEALRDKHIKKKDAPEQSTGTLAFQAVAFLLVGAGLIYCVVTGQVDEGIMQIAVMAGIVISFAYGATLLFKVLRRR